MWEALNLTPKEWMTLCHDLVPEVLRERGWHLIEAQDLHAFIDRVHGAIVQQIVRPGPLSSSEKVVRRATIHLYCHELYLAAGQQGSLQQHRAFEELGRHAQAVAFRYEQNLEVAQACVQSALAIIWEKWEQVRDPGSFLRYLETVVYREIKGYWRKAQKQKEVPMSRWAAGGQTEGDDKELEDFWEALASVPPADDDLVSQELREQLWPEVQRAFGKNQRYAAVIVGYYLYDLSTPVLAEMLQTTGPNIHVIKSRALARLRTNTEFIERFADALGGKL